MRCKATIGIVTENGVIQRVVTDDTRLQGAQIIVLHDGEPGHLLRATFDDEIVSYLQRAQDLAACGGIAIACEVASEALLHFSRQTHDNPKDALRVVEKIMSALARAVSESLAAGSTPDRQGKS